MHLPESLDVLEGVAMLEDEYLEELQGTKVVEAIGVENVIGNLAKNWKNIGASQMVMNIVTKGLNLNFDQGLPGKYKEKNNRSSSKNEEFAREELIR